MTTGFTFGPDRRLSLVSVKNEVLSVSTLKTFLFSQRNIDSSISHFVRSIIARDFVSIAFVFNI